MARGAVPVTSFTKSGVAPAAETNGNATDNHTVANDGRTVILARNSNGSATARTLTVHLQPGTVDGQAIAPRTYSIAAGASRYVGPFPTGTYGTTMNVDVDHAEIKLSAYRMA